MTDQGLELGPLDEEAMVGLAADLARALKAGDMLALQGDLGAGKTTLARAIIRAVANDPELEVPSPTFTLVQEYDLSTRILHADLYRIGGPGEWVELGLDEAADDAVILVEWPERAGSMLPDTLICIGLAEDEAGGRRLAIDGPSDAMARIARSLEIRHFLDEAGWTGAVRSDLSADASARNYECIERDARTAILMDAPRKPDGPAVYGGRPYSRVAGLAEDVGAFVAIANGLRDRGFCAPEVFAHDLGSGLVLLEHLGSGSVLDAEGRPVADRYEAAVRMLAHLHCCDWPDHLAIDPHTDHTVPHFDATVFSIEASLFADWYLADRLQAAPSRALVAGLADLWNHAHQTLGAAGRTLILRDFHSPNIIWRDGRSGLDRIGLIDFQDALLGSPAYDVMSLVHDARVDMPDALQDRLIEAYCQERAALDPDFDRPTFEREAAIVSAQRSAKILGIFVRLDKRDGKPGYRRHVPRVERTLGKALDHPALHSIRDLLSEHAIEMVAP